MPSSLGASDARASFEQTLTTSVESTVLQSLSPMHPSIACTRSPRNFGNAAAFSFLQPSLHVCTSLWLSQALTRSQSVEQNVDRDDDDDDDSSFCAAAQAGKTVVAESSMNARTKIRFEGMAHLEQTAPPSGDGGGRMYTQAAATVRQSIADARQIEASGRSSVR
jgi:hypothetical protein